jgi:uncharacterized iron-regulated protein
MYNYIYRFIQNLIGFFLNTHNNFYKDIANLLSKSDFEEIHDVGGSDGILLNYINHREYKYFCYDINRANILRNKTKYKKYKNITFYFKSIDDINIRNNKKKIFLFIGVFHHLKDDQIISFLKKTSSNDSIIALDPFFHQNQNFLSIFLKKLDDGKYIRDYIGYKKILIKFQFKKRINYYLKFYSHLISYKNINKKLIKILIS